MFVAFKNEYARNEAGWKQREAENQKEFNEAAVRKEQAEKGVVEMEQLIALQENKILQLKESHGRMKVQLPPTDVNGQPNAETVYRLEEAQNKINLAEIEMQRIKYNKNVFGANAKAQEKLMEDISGRKHWSSGEGGMLDGALNKLWDDWFGDEEEQKVEVVGEAALRKAEDYIPEDQQKLKPATKGRPLDMALETPDFNRGMYKNIRSDVLAKKEDTPNVLDAGTLEAPMTLDAYRDATQAAEAKKPLSEYRKKKFDPLNLNLEMDDFSGLDSGRIKR